VKHKSQAQKNMHQLLSVARAHKKVLSKRLETTGVYQSQHRLLMYLAGHTCKSQKQIAEDMEISTATLAVSIKKLEHGGYLEKTMDASDNRLNTITITEKGRNVVEKSLQIFEEVDSLTFAGLSDDEMLTLSELLARVEKNLTTVNEEEKE